MKIFILRLKPIFAFRKLRWTPSPASKRNNSPSLRMATEDKPLRIVGIDAEVPKNINLRSVNDNTSGDSKSSRIPIERQIPPFIQVFRLVLVLLLFG